MDQNIYPRSSLDQRVRVTSVTREDYRSLSYVYPESECWINRSVIYVKCSHGHAFIDDLKPTDYLGHFKLTA